MNTPTPPTSPSPARPSLGARLWPAALVMVLVVTVLANLYIMRLAGADRSMTIEPNYYTRALDWDATQAQAGANAALGWRFTLVSVAPSHVQLQASDAAGTALSGLTVHLRGSANRTGDQLEQVTLVETGPGMYVAPMRLAGGGWWRMTLTAERDGQKYEQTSDFDAGVRAP